MQMCLDAAVFQALIGITAGLVWQEQSFHRTILPVTEILITKRTN